MKSFFIDLFFYCVSALAGILVGTLLVDYNVVDKIRFWWRPVVQMQGEIYKGPTDDYIVIHMYGKKLRGVECEYKGVTAFGDRIFGLPVDLIAKRVDIPENGSTKDEGSYDIGYWKVHPITGVYRVRVNVAHICGRSPVSTEIASINLERN